MAFNKKEEAIIRWSLENNKQPQEIREAIIRFRATGSPQQETTPEQQESFLGETKQDIQQVGVGIKTDIGERLGKLDEISQAQESGEQGAVRSAFQRFGQGVGFASDVVGRTATGALKAVLPQSAEEKVKSTIGEIGQDILSEENTAPGARAIRGLVSRFEEIKKTDPAKARDIEASLGIGSLLVDVAGGGLAKQAGAKIVKGSKEFAEKLKVVRDELPQLSKPTPTRSVLGDTIKDITPTSDVFRDKNLAKALRLSPVDDIANIEQLTGNNIGEFMGRFELIKDTPKETVDALAKFQQRNYDRVGDVVSLVDNQYTFADVPAFKSIVDFLEGEFTGSTSEKFKQALAQVERVKNAPAFELTDVQQTKRMFDEITSFYKRSGDVKDAKRAQDMANNMSDVRQFVASEVKTQYPDIDISVLNNNVQTSRAILDAVVKRSGKADTASLFSLGDMAVIGAGNVTAPGAGFVALFGKKLFESAPIRLRIAKKADEIARKSADGGITKADLAEMDELIQSELAKSITPDDKKALLEMREQLKNGDSFKQGAIPEIADLATEAKKFKTADEFVEALDEGQAGLFVEHTPIKRILERNIGNKTLADIGVDPEKSITVYRGIDDLSGTVKREIVDGDYVASSRELAESYTGNAEDVVELKIKAKDFYVEDVEQFSDDVVKRGIADSHIEGVYTTQKPITDSQLKEIWGKANR